MKKVCLSMWACLLLLTGCETIHTGILGDIPTGMKPSGAMKEGDLYIDPLNRFSVVVPDSRNLVPKKTAEGVVFVGKELDRGDIYYAVLVYSVADPSLSDIDTLEATLNGIKYKIELQKFAMTIIHKELKTCEGYPCMDAYYDVGSKNYGQQLYVARFVKVGSQVYNIYFSDASFFIRARSEHFEKEHIEKYFLPHAEKLYQGVKFQPEN